MGSFYDDFKKKQNKRQNKPTLLKVPQVVPQKPAHQDNSRRATAARNREQQRVQAHQNAQRPASTYLTGGSTTRSQPYAANQQRNTVFQQRGNTRQGLSGTGSRNTQQNNVRQPASTYLTGGSVTRSQPYAASQQNQLFSAKKAAEQRRNPRQNVSTANKSSGVGNPTLTQFLKNSMDWHKTSDPDKRAQLHAQNDALRRKLGYDYNPQTGASFDKFGHEMTAGVRMAYGSKPTERLNQATQLLHTSGVMGKTDKATVYPTAMQAAQGLTEDYFSGQTGYNAHKTMHDLFNRSDETWSREDTQSRDRARQELSDEMSRIMKRYGLTYQPRDNADDIMNRLKAAGADEQTLAYVQENIDLRHAADRLGNSLEAVGKRWAASLPSLVDTSRQVSANVEESRQSEEYRQLEEQEQTLELTLQGMNSTAADGSVPADYQAVYDQLQEVRKRKNELTVNKGVDPNKWSQRMLREANEAQANAEAGLAPAPRWLTEQGISLAGNAPVMAASAIPVVGPAVGSIMMGGQAAGQRAFELNEQGKGARESLTRGLTSGAIEAVSERLPLGQMSKILHSGGVNAVKNILIQMGEEATEESASYFMNYVADKAAQDPDAKFSLQELAQSAAGGAFGGLVFGTAGAVGSRGVYGSPTENQLTNRPMMNYEVQADTPYLQVERFTEPLTQTMVKIDEQMRKANALPEGTIKQQYTAALQEDAQRVSKQLSILENNRAELMQARNIAERFGAKFELADLGPAGGKYENGTITVNPYSSSPVRQVLVHELTHHLENSGSYNALQEMALHLFTQEQGVSADVLRDNITRMYAEQGVTLGTQAANRELTAAFCEKRLFQDDASIQRLAQTDVSLFQRIRQWIADTVIRLRGTKEQQQLLELQRRYEKAARTVGAVQDRGAQYTFGREYDNETLAKAVQMEQEGADKDTIWNTLGVIRDTKGNWINEIDDSRMNYDEFGLYQLRKDPDFRRLEELEDKANATAENFGFSPEEYAEWEKLTDKYGDAVWDDKYLLRDYLKHDELFKRYPSLQGVSLVFEPMKAGEFGYFQGRDNSIHLNEDFKRVPESTLLHEIQHFVQNKDNRPGGATPEYWRLMNESADEWLDRNLLQDRKQKIIERMNTIEQQVGYNDFYDSLLDREEAGELTSEQVDALDREFVARYPELEALRNELYNDVYMKLKELGKGKRDPNELYRNTAGEIEARESASRRNMTAEERRQKTPDLGWDRAVFAEDAGTTAEIKYPVYTPEAIHENQRKLRDMQPVTKLTGNEFAKGDTDLMTQVLNYFDSLGNSVYSEQFGDVALTKSSWRSERRHGMTALKANTFAAVPDVIRNGVVIDYMQKHDGAVDRIVAAAPIQIGTDADYYVGVMLQRDQQSQRLYLHDVVALKKQGQKNKTQTWHQNSDVSRSSSNLDISSILRNALDGNTSVQNTFGFTPEQIAKGTVPLSDAMQYGKTPEQAVMEARAKAEGEKFSEGVNANGSINGDADTAYSIGFMQKRNHPSSDGSSNSPFGSGAHTQMTSDNSISPNAENGNTEVKPLGNYEMYGKSREQAMRELQNKLTEKRSFLHDDDYKQVRAVQSAELRETWEQARPVHEQIEKFQKNHPLSAKDEQLLQAAMVNGATNTFSQCDDPAAVMHRYQLQQELNRRMQPIKDYQRTRGETMALNAEEMADTIAEFAKDKKIPGAYSRETMERNSYDIFGKNNRDKAEQLNDEYFAPVHKAVADRTNYVNTMRQQVADLHLSKHESALVQMALEGRNDVAAEYIKNNKIKVTSKLQKNVADGVATFQAIYKELYEALNETLLSNGMKPVRARKNYAPHFVKDKPDTLLSRIRYSFGWGKDSSVNIGTDLAGITDDFSPGKKWFGNLLQREGELTDYDAVAGFDRYIETAGDIIFLTDSVQQLRSLEDALRYRLSDEGTREMVNQIRNDRSLNALERHQKIDEAYNPNQDNIQKLYNQKKLGMGGYVSNLHEYINNLAGKKARADRGWEEMIGRQIYTVAKNVEGRVAANMIAMNPGSWITNFIPITQATGEVSTANLIKAMRDTVKSAVKDDGFTDGSVFLTNREGTQFLDRTLTRKISDIAGMPMEAIDHFASNVVTRAKYLQNIQDGMGLQEAFDNADTFAANLMADRSKGAQPTAFNSVNPVRKVFTMFQLEVNNQLSYLFKDLPRAKQSLPKLAWAYTKVFTGAYLFNAVYHQLTGRDSALDPIGMIVDAFGLDDDDDKDKKKKSGVDIALDLGENIAEQIPFVGGLIGGGRVPLFSAVPEFDKLTKEYENGYDGKRIALDAAKSAANSAAYLLLPFGGGALKRTAEGAATVYAGGSYSLDKNGEKILQFPQYGQRPLDYVQAILFGKSSLPGAQEWADNGYDSLNADETKAFDELRQHMNWFKDENGNTIDNSEAVFAAIKAMRAITDEMKEKYPDDYTAIAAGKKREMLFNDNDLNEIQKKYLDRELIGSSVGASGDYSSRDMFDISQKVREARQDDAMEALKHGISVDEFANWDGIIEETLADNEVDAKDFVEGQNNELYKKNEALLAILNEYGNSGEHTDAEKNAFADYLLISAMEDSDKERWDEVKGTVNATDFVKFASDMTTYNKEYKGSGLSKSDAMQSILDGYKNLSDTQKDALFGVYSDSASGNAFHISKYEEAIKDNSFYSYLKDAGKKELRSLLNSYEKHVADNAKLDGWEAKAAVAKEAGISPGIYALFQVALQEADTDGKGLSQAKAKAAVESVGGLTQAQKAYLWQSANKSWKKNPYGSATVSEYKYAGGEFANPVAGGTISSKFGPRDTFATSNGASSSRWHKSIDIAAPAGTAIKSVQDGKVTANGWVDGYGWTIEVTHANGYVSMYHHMQNSSSVAVGTEVKQGQTIGNVGSTGNSTGPHLDLTITKDGTPVDPASLIGDYKNAKTGYVYEGSPVYTQLSSAASKSKKSSGGSRRSSGGSSSGGLKQLKGLSGLKGLGF
nr:peptidoglycan DD-metalloendopeptidase family protein [Butyricicoccus sp. OF30-11pH9A]